jgi:hypothetical protein
MTIINQWFVALPLVDCCYERFWKVKKKGAKSNQNRQKGDRCGGVGESAAIVCKSVAGWGHRFAR